VLFDRDNNLEKSSKEFNCDKKEYFNNKKGKLRNGSYFTKWYNFYFDAIRHRDMNVLEIGIAYGESVKMWKNFFFNSEIYGVDIKEKDFQTDQLEGVNVFIGDQGDTIFLKNICNKVPDGFDIIIDDGSHITNDQVISFEYLFRRLNHGGIYVIEDVHTSYVKKFKKKPHKSLIDYLKKRIDDVNVGGRLGRYTKQDILSLPSLNPYEEMIESIHFYPDICFVLKKE